MTTHNDPELIDTVATHIQWLRRDGLTDDHRADNEQSADYLARLLGLLVLVTGRLTERAAVPPQRPEPDDDTDLIDVAATHSRWLRHNGYVQPADCMDRLSELLVHVMGRVAERAQRPGITRQQAEKAAELRRLLAKATPLPWDERYVREAVRHVARNCDYIGGDDPDFGWDRYDDAPLITAAINALPELLAVWALLADSTTQRATRYDVVTALEGVIDEDCTSEAFSAAEKQLVALLGADPREVVFRGTVADWENPSPDSGDWPKASLDGTWLVDPASAVGREVQVIADSTTPEPEEQR
jgi:hypothetical protein